MSVATGIEAKPKLRGVSHQVAFVVSLVTGPALVAAAHRWPARLATAVYALTTTALFGVSALFHRRSWSPAGSRRMRRLDHSTIYLAIAGTSTAVAGLALRGGFRVVILAVVWTGPAGATPDKPAVIDDRPDGTVLRWTFAELNERVNRVAHVLLGAGAGPGVKVVWCGQNSPGVLAVTHACRKIGAIAVPLSYRLSPE